MPVRKFRSIEEMSESTWRRPGDPELYRVIAALWAVGRRTRSRVFPPGVHRYASIDEMSRAQEAWADTRAALDRLST